MVGVSFREMVCDIIKNPKLPARKPSAAARLGLVRDLLGG
jgi:hypothetical protein